MSKLEIKKKRERGDGRSNMRHEEKELKNREWGKGGEGIEKQEIGDKGDWGSIN